MPLAKTYGFWRTSGTTRISGLGAVPRAGSGLGVVFLPAANVNVEVARSHITVNATRRGSRAERRAAIRVSIGWAAGKSTPHRVNVITGAPNVTSGCEKLDSSWSTTRKTRFGGFGAAAGVGVGASCHVKAEPAKPAN